MSAEMVVRTAKEEDVEQLALMGSESFPSGFPFEERMRLLRDHPRRNLTEDVLIGEVNGAMVVSLSALPFHIWIGGVRLPMLGIAGVANALEARRQGYASKLCIEAIRRGREAGYPLSMLYPFRFDFYKKLGWGAIGELVEYNFHPSSLPLFETRKNVRKFKEADLISLKSCYQHFVEQGNCLAERPDKVWQVRHADWQNRKRIIMVYEENHEVRGYLSFTFEHVEGMLVQVLGIQEMVYLDRRSYQGLLGFLSSLSDQVSCIRYWARTDEAFHYLLKDPRDLQHKILSGLFSRTGQYGFGYMLRILDLPTALKTHTNYNGITGSVVFQVRDDQIPENNGFFKFTLTDGQATVSALDGEKEGDATVKLSIDLFAQLYVGALTAERAYFLGLMEVSDESVLPWLTNAFRLPRPFLLDQF